MTSLILAFGPLLLTAYVVMAMTPETVTVCMKETGFDGDPMTLDFNSTSFPNDAKCFVACTMQKDKVMKDDGTIDKAAAKELYDRLIEDGEVKKSLLKVLDECEAEGFLAAKSNKCETAFQFSKCNRDKAAMKFGRG